MTEEDSSLASKCMAFCQALASQGQSFNFSISIGSDFSFSLDTRSKATTSQGAKKMPSPSTQRRNARRREEFLAKKQQEARTSSDNPVVAKKPKCDQCEYVATTEKGLRQHIRMKHKEVLRSSPKGPSDISISPLLEVSREECSLNTSEYHHSEETFTPFTYTCKECEEEFTVEEYVDGFLVSMCCEKTKQLCQDCCYQGACDSFKVASKM